MTSKLIDCVCEVCGKQYRKYRAAIGKHTYCGNACAVTRLSKKPILTRIKEKTNFVLDKISCWEFQGSRAGDGYGVLKLKPEVHGRASVVAHREMLEIITGEHPSKEIFACHRCDNPPCVRPSHLYWGTRENNAQDAINRRRQYVGKLNPASKLTESQVIDMRALHESGEYLGVDLAQKFAVDPCTVSEIVNRKTWQHI